MFKWSSLDPAVKCSEVVAAINIEKVTPQIIVSITELLTTAMSIHGLECCAETSDAAGCNWVAAKDIMSTNTIEDVLPQALMDKYPDIDFKIMIVSFDEVTGQWFFFIPDMPHLTKNIVTTIEKSSTKSSKRNIKYGKCFINLQLIELVWLATGGATGQFHETKLSVYHFDKNAHSRMNVSLAVQILSQSVAKMIRDAIDDEEVVVGSIRNKGILNHTADLCEKWNLVVDICNGRAQGGKLSPHTPANANERITTLLDVLKWFSKWKKLHDTRVQSGEATAYNFFADETWFCIRALILANVGMIHTYCVVMKVELNPRSLTTDPVEHFFGDARQMIGGSTSALTARQMNQAGFKANAFNAFSAKLVGNNKSAFVRHKRF